MSVLRPIASLSDGRPSTWKKLVVCLLIGLGVGGAGGYWLGRRAAPDLPGTSAAASLPPGGPGSPDLAAAGTLATATSPGGGPVVANPLPAATPAAPPKAAPADNSRRLDLTIAGSLFATLAEKVEGREADVLSAIVGRLLIWWVDLRREVLPGDQLQILYRPTGDSTEYQILALHYQSRKQNRAYRVYFFRPEGAKYGHYYDENGLEVEQRLENSPIDQYEKITEHMNLSGRRHKGVDFKTDVGTTVVAPFRARVERRNWHTGRNGNCLEITYLDSGVSALFLHLDEVLPETQPGKIVEAGTPLARTGNTGHSTAPHLHYQLQKGGGRPMDPFKFHKTTRLALAGTDLDRFKAQRDSWDKSLTPGEPARESAPAPSGSNPSSAKPG
jgi:murein DD-endopeptidase